MICGCCRGAGEEEVCRMFAKVAGSTTEARCVRPAGSSDSTFGEGLLAFPRALDFSWGETEPAHSTYPHASPGGAVDHRTPLKTPDLQPATYRQWCYPTTIDV